MKRELKARLYCWTALIHSEAAAQIPMKRELKVCRSQSFPSFNRLAAAQIPMKRELKVSAKVCTSIFDIPAAAQIPMKRELKELWNSIKGFSEARCSPNPYEEGTERKLLFQYRSWTFRAAAQIPMKRELKDNIFNCINFIFIAAAQIPMKRELKDGLKCSPRYSLTPRCSPNPYEEGTERHKLLPTTASQKQSCSPNPYEEGTERIERALSLSGCISLQPKSLWRGNWKCNICICYLHIRGAAAQIPMKRELKE